MLDQLINKGYHATNFEAIGELESLDDVATQRRLELIANAHCIRENIVDTFSCENRVSQTRLYAFMLEWHFIKCKRKMIFGR